MNRSESIKSLAAALAKAQAEFPSIPRDKTVQVKTKSGGTYTFAYAPLDTIMEKIRPALKANGLAFMQSLNGESLTTTLLHTSGEWLATDAMPIRAVDSGPQALGSAITYARRYALTALLGLVTEDDDDGNAAEGNVAKATTAKAGRSASDGCLDALEPDEQVRAKQIASGIVDCWDEGKELAAYELFYEGNLSNEMMLGIWEILRPHSKIRNQLKKMKDANKEPVANA
jgi:hypothetical protein